MLFHGSARSIAINRVECHPSEDRLGVDFARGRRPAYARERLGRMKVRYTWMASESQTRQTGYFIFIRFASRKSSTLLNELKNRGVPANESGETGPIVMNEYSREAVSNDECGSRKSW